MPITISGSSGISGVDGSAATPALQGSDSNTGISFGTDEVNINTDGTTRATVDSSGRLLVGTSTSTNVAGFGETKIQLRGNYESSVTVVNTENNANTCGLILAKDRSTSIVQNGDPLGGIYYQGYDGSAHKIGANILAYVDGTPGANDMPGRLSFSTTPDGSTTPVERMRIYSSGNIGLFETYNNTTAAAANMQISDLGNLFRSTSSIKYKTDVETLEDSYADALLDCRPVWYRSTCSGDNPDYGYWGFIAEEVAEIDPRLVHWKTAEITYDENGSVVEAPCDPEPEGVQYDRFVPHLLNLIKRQKEQLDTQSAAIASLEARLTAFEGGTN